VCVCVCTRVRVCAYARATACGVCVFVLVCVRERVCLCVSQSQREACRLRHATQLHECGARLRLCCTQRPCMASAAHTTRVSCCAPRPHAQRASAGCRGTTCTCTCMARPHPKLPPVSCRFRSLFSASRRSISAFWLICKARTQAGGCIRPRETLLAGRALGHACNPCAHGWR
jgi:hypothetical protein